MKKLQATWQVAHTNLLQQEQQEHQEQQQVSVLVLVALSRDQNRKGCTTKPHDKGGTGASRCKQSMSWFVVVINNVVSVFGLHGFLGMWDYCDHLFAQSNFDSPSKDMDEACLLDKSKSFYVGNAAGRKKDHSDCDLNFVSFACARRCLVVFGCVWFCTLIWHSDACALNCLLLDRPVALAHASSRRQSFLQVVNVV